MSETVVVLGASPNPARYSHRAVVMLAERGHRVLPVNPYHREVAGLPCLASVTEIREPVHTVTLYIGADLLEKQMDALLALRPGRLIFNPGSEAPELEARFQEAGIATERACTLVLLRTGQF